MSKIFICYRREDSIETVGRMNSWLSMRLPGGEVFFDVHTIIPGVNYRDLIEHTLTFEAAIVLVVIGKTWASIVDDHGVKRLDELDDPVRREIELAFEHKK